MTLVEVVARLEELDPDDTIYATEPWTEHSQAIVAREPDAGGLPADAAKAGMRYFLEISIAAEFLGGWRRTLDRPPSASRRCQRLIEYAVHDA